MNSIDKLKALRLERLAQKRRIEDEITELIARDEPFGKVELLRKQVVINDSSIRTIERSIYSYDFEDEKRAELCEQA